MIDLQLTTLPTESLLVPSDELSKKNIADASMQDFLDALIPAMYEFQGIGLAAPQVGKNIQACVIGKDAIPKEFAAAYQQGIATDLILINPSYEKTSKRKVTESEGCLSVPGKAGPTPRYKDISVTALLRDGTPVEFEAHNFFARVIQHETDHLAGVLYIDKANEVYETS